MVLSRPSQNLPFYYLFEIVIEEKNENVKTIEIVQTQQKHWKEYISKVNLCEATPVTNPPCCEVFKGTLPEGMWVTEQKQNRPKNAVLTPHVNLLMGLNHRAGETDHLRWKPLP